VRQPGEVNHGVRLGVDDHPAQGRDVEQVDVVQLDAGERRTVPEVAARHLVAAPLELGEQVRAEEAPGAGDEDLHPRPLATRWRQ
jgi:hypothetical protein